MPLAAKDLRGLIGNTPMVQLTHMGIREDVEVFAKLEYFNPGGSVKDRIAVEMIDQALASGNLKPGGTIIEPTAGNTGLGLAMVAAPLGFKFICVMPEKFKGEKSDLMEGLGAKVVITPNEAGMMGAIEKARELVKQTPGSYSPNQFEHQGNPDAHYKTTGPEIWDAMEGRVDVFVAGCGSGGTFTGTVKFLKEKNPDLIALAVEPIGSTIGGGEKGSYKVEGIGNWFVPGTMHLDLVDRFVQVRDEDSFDTTREMALREGLLGGGSSGAALFAAMQFAEQAKPGSRIAVIFPDSSERYLQKKIYHIKG